MDADNSTIVTILTDGKSKNTILNFLKQENASTSLSVKKVIVLIGIVKKIKKIY